QLGAAPCMTLPSVAPHSSRRRLCTERSRSRRLRRLSGGRSRLAGGAALVPHSFTTHAGRARTLAPGSTRPGRCGGPGCPACPLSASKRFCAIATLFVPIRTCWRTFFRLLRLQGALSVGNAPPLGEQLLRQLVDFPRIPPPHQIRNLGGPVLKDVALRGSASQRTADRCLVGSADDVDAWWRRRLGSPFR